MAEYICTPVDCPDAIALGVPFMDHEHAVFLRLYWELAAAAAYPEGDNRLFATCFRALTLFAQAHFDHEERAMRELGLGSMRDHKRAHDAWIRDAEDFAVSIEDSYDRFGCWALTRYVRRWLECHITHHDRSLAAAIRRQTVPESELLAVAFDLGSCARGEGIARVLCIQPEPYQAERLRPCPS